MNVCPTPRWCADADVAPCCALCCLLQLYVRRNQWVFWTAWALAIGLLLVISCVEKARRSFPTNMLLLGAFTAVQAFLVGTLSAYYNIEAVAIAFAVTSAAVIAITIFAINTKFDVTKYGTLLLVALVAFIVLLIMGLFWVNKVLWLVLSGVACLIFSAYLVSQVYTGEACVALCKESMAACAARLAARVASVSAELWGCAGWQLQVLVCGRLHVAIVCGQQAASSSVCAGTSCMAARRECLGTLCRPAQSFCCCCCLCLLLLTVGLHHTAV